MSNQIKPEAGKTWINKRHQNIVAEIKSITPDNYLFFNRIDNAYGDQWAEGMTVERFVKYYRPQEEEEAQPEEVVLYAGRVEVCGIDITENLKSKTEECSFSFDLYSHFGPRSQESVKDKVDSDQLNEEPEECRDNFIPPHAKVFELQQKLEAEHLKRRAAEVECETLRGTIKGLVLIYGANAAEASQEEPIGEEPIGEDSIYAINQMIKYLNGVHGNG